ncbi:MAG: hypothetical protein WCT16_01515 [Candidatus Buchananbacteria bacterium]
MQISDYIILLAFVALCYISIFPLHLLYGLILACWAYLRYCFKKKGEQSSRAQPKKDLIYLICPVRNITPEQQTLIDDYVKRLEKAGLEVHYPPRDADQNDSIGMDICLTHAAAMEKCSFVHIFWDSKSTGSHFDLGMAFMAHKPVYLVQLFTPDSDGKSFLKVIKKMEEWGQEFI